MVALAVFSKCSDNQLEKAHGWSIYQSQTNRFIDLHNGAQVKADKRKDIVDTVYLPLGRLQQAKDLQQDMPITVLMVAEKPSLAASIAHHLSGGKVQMFAAVALRC